MLNPRARVYYLTYMYVSLISLSKAVSFGSFTEEKLKLFFTTADIMIGLFCSGNILQVYDIIFNKVAKFLHFFWFWFWAKYYFIIVANFHE